MGITSNDIAAQRAMLARGEEKRKADWRAAERERLRDTFAAAALPLCTRNGRNAEQISESAYKLADAMLVERSRTGKTAADTPPQSRAGKNTSETVPEVAKCTERENDHDAAPDARVQQSTREPERSLLPQSDAVERGLHRTGNTSSPELYEENDEKRTNTNMNRTIDKRAYEGDIVSRLKNWRGLHLAHGGKLFEESAAEIARLREAIRRLADQDATLSVQGGDVTVTMDATLTDEEREDIKWAAKCADDYARVGHRQAKEVSATLRSLLERLS